MLDLTALLDERERLLEVPIEEFNPERLAEIDDLLIAAIPGLLECCRCAAGVDTPDCRNSRAN
jgi:hypothetical protein